MATISDILSLVPSKTDVPDLLTAIDESETAVPVLASVRALLDYHKGRKKSEDIAKKLVKQLISETDTAEEDLDELGFVRRKVISEALKKLGKFVLRRVLTPVVRFAFRTIMAVSRFAIRTILQLVIRPVLTTLFSFIVTNPLLAGAALLLGGLGYLAYQKWFKKEASVMLPSSFNEGQYGFETEEGQRQRKLEAQNPYMEMSESGVPLVKSPTDLAQDLMTNKTKQQRFDLVKQDLVDAANRAGIEVSTLVKIAHFESKFDTNAAPVAKNATRNTQTLFDGRKALSTAHGLGQFLDASWTQYINKYGYKYGINTNGGTLTKAQAAAYRRDPKIQAFMLAEFTKENILIGRKLGGYDDAANVYALHNLGQAGGSRFLKALHSKPRAAVSSILPANVISGNPALYGNGSISIREAYRRMVDYMNAGATFAKEAQAIQDRGTTQVATEAVTKEKDVNTKTTKQAATMTERKPQAAANEESTQANNTQVAMVNGKLVRVKT